MHINKKIASSLKASEPQIKATVDLLDGGNTVPFIARYRKEATGGLTDEQLEQVVTLLDKYRALEGRRESILKSLADQQVEDSKVLKAVQEAQSVTELEDLYAPFKPKRRTRASVAKDKGLDKLAQAILTQDAASAPAALVKKLSNAQVVSPEEALAGAKDIIAEMISDTPQVRSATRERALRKGQVRCAKKKGAEVQATYQEYYDFQVEIPRIRPHQMLAINRAENEGALSFNIDLNESEWIGVIQQLYRANPKSPLYTTLMEAIQDSGKRLLLPSIERDIRNALMEEAEAHAIQVFAENLKNLLMQPPLPGQVVMGVDPGFRTGCKVAVVDPTGRVLDTATIYPHEPQRAVDASLRALAELIEKHDVTLISIGNGTASRETETVVSELLESYSDVKYLVTSEAGASVYSASALARKELPDLDVSLRGAVSIARRVQDPLAELVKIDPRSIGVGMYQHDIDPKKLEDALRKTITHIVSEVGVDLNTASPALLGYVAGITEKTAQSIVDYRNFHGPFKSRKELKKVSGLGERAFEQCAGFLRIYGGAEPLDMSAIHPESYKAAKEILKLAQVEITMPAKEKQKRLAQVKTQFPNKDLAELLGIGEPTLIDILAQIIQPVNDPRANRPKPVLRSGVLTIDEVKPGMSFTGTVRNVADFGAFIDIGLKSDALLHRSKYKSAALPKVGDVLSVLVDTVDLDRGRIGLSLP